jgi:uncharacterized protein YndB with AHSA1/START domain
MNMKWVARILAGLVAMVVFGVLALLIAGKRPNHGHIAREIAIDRPAAQVFRWIATEELLKKWIGGLLELRPESSPADGSEVGRKFHIIEAYKGERVEMKMEVMKFERDRDVVVRVVSAGDPNNGFVETAEYRLTEAGGKTRFRIEAQTNYYGYMPRLFEPLVTRGAKKKLKQDLKRLKALVEAEPSMETGETLKAKPAAEMERLKFYVGDWAYSEVYPKSALFPNGGRSTGSWTAQLGPRGLSVINAFASHGTGDNYEGMEIMTWDAKEKAYRDHAIWYDTPGQWEFTGRFEGDALIYRASFDYLGKHVKFRSETRALKEGGFTLDEFGSVNGGKEEVILHGKAEKK